MKLLTKVSLLIGVMLLTACSTSSLDKLQKSKAVDVALCSELKSPIDQAVNTTIEYASKTPPQVINDWTSVVKGFDAGCNT